MSTHHRKIAVACALVTVVVVSVGSALAATKLTVKAKANAALGRTIVVNSKGQTLYRLSGESKGHLKCATKMCLGFWPPLTVSSASTKLEAGPGVRGKLTLLHRSGGVLQVMLGGKPLYTFAGDKAGTASGNNLKSFGGTWNVLSAGATTTPTTTTTTAPTTTPALPAY